MCFPIAECLYMKYPQCGRQLICNFFEKVRWLSIWRRICCWSSYFPACCLFLCFVFFFNFAYAMQECFLHPKQKTSSPLLLICLIHTKICPGVWMKTFWWEGAKVIELSFQESKASLNRVSMMQSWLNTTTKLKSCLVWLVFLASDLAVSC